MPQKLPVNNFECNEDTSQCHEYFMKNCYEESDEGYILQFNIRYPGMLHNNLPFLSERMKIEKAGKLVANLHDKIEYVLHIRNLKQSLNHELVLKKSL